MAKSAPLQAKAIMGLTLAATVALVLVLWLGNGDPRPVFFALVASGLVTFFVWRACIKRYRESLESVGFVASGLIAISVVAIWLFAPDNASSPARDTAREGAMAWIACQQVALRQFRAPTQTEFDTYPVAFNQAGPPGAYSVQGAAHAPNGFGAKIKHLVICDMTETGDPSSSSGWLATSAVVVGM